MVTLRGYVFESHGHTLCLTGIIKANVLIDDDKHARLADFGLLTIVSDTNLVSSASFTPGGTWRWMSPELFDPKSFGLKADCPTKRSDCYALGMLIYEVLSGGIPFPRHNDRLVVAKILTGERPERPRGATGTWFTNEVWCAVESCWEHIPRDRPKIGDVLQRLEDASESWTPTSQTVAGPQPTRPPIWDPGSSTDDSGFPSLPHGIPSHSPREHPKGEPDESNI